MDASLLSPHLLPDDQLTRDNCKEYLSRFLGWLHARFDAGDNIIELVGRYPLRIYGSAALPVVAEVWLRQE